MPAPWGTRNARMGSLLNGGCMGGCMLNAWDACMRRVYDSLHDSAHLVASLTRGGSLLAACTLAAMPPNALMVLTCSLHRSVGTFEFSSDVGLAFLCNNGVDNFDCKLDCTQCKGPCS